MIIKRIVGIILVIVLFPFVAVSALIGFIGEVLMWIGEKIEASGHLGLFWNRVAARLIRNWVWEKK